MRHGVAAVEQTWHKYRSWPWLVFRSEQEGQEGGSEPRRARSLRGRPGAPRAHFLRDLWDCLNATFLFVVLLPYHVWTLTESQNPREHNVKTELCLNPDEGKRGKREVSWGTRVLLDPIRCQSERKLFVRIGFRVWVVKSPGCSTNPSPGVGSGGKGLGCVRVSFFGLRV